MSTLYKARLRWSAPLRQKRVWEVLGMLLGDVMCHIDNSIATSQVPYCSLSSCEQHHTPITNKDFLFLIVDCKTIGGALPGYPTTYQILVAEGVSREDYTIDYRYN